MTITRFLFICILFITALVVYVCLERTKIFGSYPMLNINRKQNPFRWIYLLAVLLVCIAGAHTAAHYIYPSDKRIFSNTTYHALQHKGYRVSDGFLLTNGNTLQQEGLPKLALWDDHDGRIELNHDTLHLTDYFEPFYIYDKKNEKYDLINSIIGENADNGLIITRGLHDTLLNIKIVEYKPSKLKRYTERDNSLRYPRQYYIITAKDYRGQIVTDTSSYSRKIYQGYPILNIVAAAPRIEISEEMERILNNCYLAREHIYYKKGLIDTDHKVARLCFMPSRNFLTQDDIYINGKNYLPDNSVYQHIGIGGKMQFKSGFGTSQTDVYNIEPTDSTGYRLTFQMPHMHKLRDASGRVFITSSLDVVAKDSREGGYLFNYFSQEDNYNHINANLRYISGSAQDSIVFCYFDLQSNTNNQLRSTEVYSNEEFYLTSLDSRDEATKWIMAIQDMRQTAPIGWKDISTFLFVMFLLIMIRIVIDHVAGSKSLSVTELSIYIALISFVTIRMIIHWRVITFAPIEDVAYSVFIKMRDLTYIPLTSIPIIKLTYCVPVIMIIYTLWRQYADIYIHPHLGFANKLQNYCDIIDDKIEQRPYIIIFIFSIVLLFLGILGTLFSQAERFCNIPFPIICYLFAELASTRYEDRGINMHSTRVVNTFVILIYLFFADAGFTVIFAAFILITIAIKLLFKDRFLGYNLIGRIIPWIISLIIVVFVYTILLFEGDIMILVFNNVAITAIIASIAMIATGLAMFFYANKQYRAGDFSKIDKGIFAGIGSLFIILFTVVLCVSILDYTDHTVILRNVAASKAHMRYRAEIQKLKQGEKIDDIIAHNDFDSDDIVFIMRSAHNQWFINQYIAAGHNLQDNNGDNLYFKLQPHSTQGCTYTTQTTDLVVTRYILGEHGERVVQLLLALLGLLVICFVMEVEMQNPKNQDILKSLLILFIIAISVYLSATNRIVFVGQDFPLISLQSAVAMFFPIILMLFPMIHLSGKRMDDMIDNDSKITDIKGLYFALLLSIFTITCIYGIEQKGADQEGSQFNVSNIIMDTSERVQHINQRFEAFQRENRKSLRNKTISEIWESYKNSPEDLGYTDVYLHYLNDISANGKFFSSLLKSFEKKNYKLTDASQLLHLRKRGGYCYLAVNKQHYSIPPILSEDNAWKGNLMAAHVEEYYSLVNTKNSSKPQKLDYKDFETQLLPTYIEQLTNNVHLVYFDKTWTIDKKPLVLLNSTFTRDQKQFYNVQSDSLEITSSGTNDQIATSLVNGDVFSISTKLPQKDARIIYTRQFTCSGQNYLAKNIWLNGHRKLFYPLGKESMWSYQFANLISGVLSKEDMKEYKDSTLHLSIDYNLHKQFYEAINKEAINQELYNATTFKYLEAFYEKNYSEQINTKAALYYNEQDNKVIIGDKNICTSNMIVTIDKVNKELQKYNKVLQRHKNKSAQDIREQREGILNEALDKVISKQFDFTAVAIDGDGHIRLLFDYARHRNLDPNNITHLSKKISELYTNGSVSDEREIFGNKALMHLPMGPGSSFKPIAYTAITSQEKLNWLSLNVTTRGMSEAQNVQGQTGSDSNTKHYSWYGGIDVTKKVGNNGLSIDGGNAINHDNYIIWSDNLYHSVMIMLGTQEKGFATRIMKPVPANTPSKQLFPVFQYNQKEYCFDPEIWCDKDGDIRIPQNGGLLGIGLYDNFRIETKSLGAIGDVLHPNYYGNDSLMATIYKQSPSSRSWSYPELGSQNIADRRITPRLRTGFNQMLLGAAPLTQSSLEMAMNAYRLASLNRANDITTLLDEERTVTYEPFNVDGGWNEQEYLNFIRQQVWTQMAQVPREGTARVLEKTFNLTTKMNHGKYGKPYYLYCKTGTLNDERDGQGKTKRIRHLLVIITDRPLERIATLDELQQVKFYTLYLSYLGANKSLSNGEYYKYIDMTLRSELFQKYMEGER